MEKLNNPVWYSLNTSHKKHLIKKGDFLFYDPNTCPFGAFNTYPKSSVELLDKNLTSDNFFLVGEGIEVIPNGLRLKNHLICNQMVLNTEIEFAINHEIIPLNNAFEKELFDLVNLVQPGYFKSKTSQLGDYFGIFIDGKLVAVTGERMKMEDYSEISAVVTHPEFTGKGLAKQLVTHVSNKIIKENKTPFLHVAKQNVGAINLYEKLGYKTYQYMDFWNYEKI